MTIELSRFVHSFDDALAELGAGHHGRPDPLVCWTTLEARSRLEEELVPLEMEKTARGADGSGDEKFLKKVLVCIMGFDKIIKLI